MRRMNGPTGAMSGRPTKRTGRPVASLSASAAYTVLSEKRRVADQQCTGAYGQVLLAAHRDVPAQLGQWRESTDEVRVAAVVVDRVHRPGRTQRLHQCVAGPGGGLDGELDELGHQATASLMLPMRTTLSHVQVVDDLGRAEHRCEAEYVEGLGAIGQPATMHQFHHVVGDGCAEHVAEP